MNATRNEGMLQVADRTAEARVFGLVVVATDEREHDLTGRNPRWS